MALTLLEASKRMMAEGKVAESLLIEEFARSNELLEVLPFEGVEGSTFSYNTEASLPGVAFRGINEGYEHSNGVINPQVETLVPGGGQIEIDSYILRRGGESNKALQRRMKIKAMNELYLKTFFKGDALSNPKSFDGLQKRLTGDQVITNAENGGALSLKKLDEALGNVSSPTHIAMSRPMMIKFMAAARNQSVGGAIEFAKANENALGRRITMYAGIPMIAIEDAAGANSILNFSETCGSSSDCCSIYVLSLQPGKLIGLQGSEGMTITEIPASTNAQKPVDITRVEWDVAMAVLSGKAACRLQGITNADIVA